MKHENAKHFQGLKIPNFQNNLKMEIKYHKQLLIPVMIIAIFIFVVSLSSLYTQRVISCGEAQTCTIPIPFLIPITASIGLFIGTLVYYLMVGRSTKKEIDINKYNKIINRLFNNEEIDILKIIAREKEISQAKIAPLTGMPRLKVFRMIEKLKEKGLIEKQEKGKIRIIKIKEDITDLFQEVD